MVKVLEQSPGHFLLDTGNAATAREKAEQIAAFLEAEKREAWAPMEEQQGAQVLVRVYPPVTLPDLHLTYEVPPVQQPTEDLIKSHMVDLQYRHASTEKVLRGAKKEDFITLQVWAEANGVPVPGTAAHERILLENDIIGPGFFMKLIGMKPGQTRSFYFIAPDEPELGAWAKKKLHYHVKLSQIEAVQRPPLDDAFAQKFYQVDTLKTMILALRDNLQETYQENWRQFVRKALLYLLAEQIEVDIPADLYAAEQRLLWFNTEGQLWQELGLTEAQFEKAYEAWCQLPANQEMVYRELRTTLAMRGLIQEQNLEATSEEILVLLKPFAEQFKQPIQTVFQAFQQEGTLEPLIDQLHREKATDFLLARATLTSQGQVLKSPKI